MMANPVRPTVLLKEIRDLILTAPDSEEDDDVAEGLGVDLFRKLLQVDALVGDTRTRDLLREQLKKAKEEGRERATRALETILG